MSVLSFFPNGQVGLMNTRKSTPSPTGSDVAVTISTFNAIKSAVSDISRLFVETNIGREFDFVADPDVNVLIGDTLFESTVQYKVLGVEVYDDLEDATESYTNIRAVREIQ